MLTWNKRRARGTICRRIGTPDVVPGKTMSAPGEVDEEADTQACSERLTIDQNSDYKNTD
jgi:hypothetical protein